MEEYIVNKLLADKRINKNDIGFIKNHTSLVSKIYQLGLIKGINNKYGLK